MAANGLENLVYGQIQEAIEADTLAELNAKCLELHEYIVTERFNALHWLRISPKSPDICYLEAQYSIPSPPFQEHKTIKDAVRYIECAETVIQSLHVDLIKIREHSPMVKIAKELRVQVSEQKKTADTILARIGESQKKWRNSQWKQS